MPLGPVGVNRGRDRTWELEVQRAKRDRENEHEHRKRQIAEIMANPHHFKSTKLRHIAELKAVWAERDREALNKWYTLTCDTCGDTYRTPRNPNRVRIHRCAPCHRAHRLRQQRDYNRRHRSKIDARSQASGARQHHDNLKRRNRQKWDMEQDEARRAFTTRFGAVLPANLLVLPLLLPGGMMARPLTLPPAPPPSPSPVTAPAKTQNGRPRLPRPSAPATSTSARRTSAVVWEPEDEPD